MNGLGGNKFLLKLFILFCFAPDQTIFSVMSMWTGEHEGLFFFYASNDSLQYCWN
jgi:hypothetical protein